MNGKKKPALKNVLAAVLVSMAVTTVGWIWLHGFPLVGVPKAKDMQRVTLICMNTEKTFTDRETLELLVKASGLCTYRMGKSRGEVPTMLVIYQKNDGTNVELGADETNVWWKGKMHPLKESGSFVNILRGLFFPEMDG